MYSAIQYIHIVAEASSYVSVELFHYPRLKLCARYHLFLPAPSNWLDMAQSQISLHLVVIRRNIFFTMEKPGGQVPHLVSTVSPTMK